MEDSLGKKIFLLLSFCLPSYFLFYANVYTLSLDVVLKKTIFF
jgi:hypothetical protein